MYNRNFKINSGLLFNHINRNIVHPSAPLTTLQEENASKIEITEINTSSDESDTRPDLQQHNTFSHAWSYVDHDQFNNGDNNLYKINETARAQRRIALNSDSNIKYQTTTAKDDRSRDQYPSFYTLHGNDPYSENKNYNRKINRFTILNNLLPSDSSSEELTVDDIIQCGDAVPAVNHGHWYNDQDISNEEIIFSHDTDSEKRTIWIYSYKNNHILSENDFMITNIGSKDSSTSSNDELEYESTEIKPKVRRLATPIPYVPRLNLPLSPTLPTVTEVAEPIKQTENDLATTNNLDDAQIINDPSRTVKENKWSSPSSRIKKLSPEDTIHEEQEKEQVYCEPEIKIISNNNIVIDTINTDIKTNQNAISYSLFDDIEPSTTVVSIKQKTLIKPHIKLSPPRLAIENITDPIDKLEGNWIGKEIEEKNIVYENDIKHRDVSQEQVNTEESHIEETTAHQFFIRNLPLLKPAEWTQYLPITDSIPSLQLTIYSDSLTHKQSWYKKLFKCINCFK